MSSSTHSRKGLLLIGAFKLIKGTLLVAAAIGLIKLLHSNLQEIAAHWIDLVRVDPNNEYVAPLLSKIGLVDSSKLGQLSALTGAYGCLFLTEGVGLILAKRWAEYLSVIATASFIPFEIYEIARHHTILRIVLLIANIAIVCYLIAVLRKSKKEA